MSIWLYEHHLVGLLIGLATFLIIGLFHPLVIKGYYYFGMNCRWYFFLTGVITAVLSIFCTDIILSVLAGVTSFSCFWSIKEISEQRERVRKGWFPENPKNRDKT